MDRTDLLAEHVPAETREVLHRPDVVVPAVALLAAYERERSKWVLPPVRRHSRKTGAHTEAKHSPIVFALSISATLLATFLFMNSTQPSAKRCSRCLSLVSPLTPRQS